MRGDAASPKRKVARRGRIIPGDASGDGEMDLFDAIASLSFLFLGGRPHALAVLGAETTGCVRIAGCPGSTRCP